ncbi:unnamed protein product, partial [Laminaria digitata]
MALYHAVFRRGKVVPFVELPVLCETQLLGADAEHWQALLTYVQVSGVVHPHPSSRKGRTQKQQEAGGRAIREAGGWEGWGRGYPAGGGGDAGGGGERLARGASSTPALGLLHTANAGGCGAPSSYINRGQRKSRPTSSPRDRKKASVPVPGVSTGWPRAGWGPGSLTISRPPQSSGPAGTTVSGAAIVAALNAAASGSGTGEGVGGVLNGSGGNQGSGGGYHGSVVATTGDVDRAAKLNKKRGVVIKSPLFAQDSVSVVSEGEEGGEGEGAGEGGGGEGAGLKPFPGKASQGSGGERGPKTAAEDLTGQTDASKITDEGAPPGKKRNGISSSSNQTNSENALLPEDSSLNQEETTKTEQANRKQKPGVEHGWGRQPGNDDVSRQSQNDDLSLSGGMLLHDLDGSTLEPPSLEPPSPEQQGSPGTDSCSDGEGQQQRDTRQQRKRTMTSQYVRCPFLDPVKNKHAYEVPRGGDISTLPLSPILQEAVDSNLLAAQLYSSIASTKAKQSEIKDTLADAEWPRLGSANESGADALSGLTGMGIRGTPEEEPGERSAAQSPIDRRAKSRERRKTKGDIIRADPGGASGGGRVVGDTSLAAPDGEEEGGEGQRPSSRGDKTVHTLDRSYLFTDRADRFSESASSSSVQVSKGLTISTVSPRPEAGGLSPSRPPPHPQPSAQETPISSETPTAPTNINPPTTTTGVDVGGGGDNKKASTELESRKKRPPASSKWRGKMQRAGGRGRGRVRTGPEIAGGGGENLGGDDGGREQVMDAKKAAQHKIIEEMMAKQASKRRASGEAMKLLIAEEDERKRRRKEEEVVAMAAQEMARREMEERQRAELEERRKALAIKRAEVEAKNRQLEEERLKRETERQLADRALREENERLRQAEAARRAEAQRLANEEADRLAREEEERLAQEEEDRVRAEGEAILQASLGRERAREARERERMSPHDEDIDVIIQANLAALREADRLQKVAAAATRSEKLKSAAEAAKQKHACLLMHRADEESRVWNEAWRAEEEALPEEPAQVAPKAKTGRVRVIRDEDGNPIDIRMWDMECTAVTDEDGRLIQRETYVDGNGYTFDPREVFKGEGGGLGGRGGGRGDGATRRNKPAVPQTDPSSDGSGSEERGEHSEENEACLDAEGFLERERRWMEGIFAASRPEDISCLFHDTDGSRKFNPDEFFPMVMNERVAWPEFMAMARAALFKTAGGGATANKIAGAAVDVSSGTNRKFTTGGGGDRGVVNTVGTASVNNPKYGVDAASAPVATAAGVGGGSGGASSSSSKAKKENKDALRQKRRDGEELRRQDCHTSSPRANNKALGKFSATATATAGSSSNALALTGDDLSSTNDAAISIVPLAFGVTLRGKTLPGPDARSLFCFDLPSPGPVITIVLDGIDGDPEMFVSRGRVPRGARGGHWTSSSTYGTLRVMKIFPHDPGYGAGEYYVGVVSRSSPSRFALRVSAASAEDEMSTHMRVATAIVDNLALMSNMDPHVRLV